MTRKEVPNCEKCYSLFIYFSCVLCFFFFHFVLNETARWVCVSFVSTEMKKEEKDISPHSLTKRVHKKCLLWKVITFLLSISLSVTHTNKHTHSMFTPYTVFPFILFFILLHHSSFFFALYFLLFSFFISFLSLDPCFILLDFFLVPFTAENVKKRVSINWCWSSV